MSSFKSLKSTSKGGRKWINGTTLISIGDEVLDLALGGATGPGVPIGSMVLMSCETFIISMSVSEALRQGRSVFIVTSWNERKCKEFISNLPSWNYGKKPEEKSEGLKIAWRYGAGGDRVDSKGFYDFRRKLRETEEKVHFVQLDQLEQLISGIDGIAQVFLLDVGHFMGTKLKGDDLIDQLRKLRSLFVSKYRDKSILFITTSSINPMIHRIQRVCDGSFSMRPFDAKERNIFQGSDGFLQITKRIHKNSLGVFRHIDTEVFMYKKTSRCFTVEPFALPPETSRDEQTSMKSLF